MGTSNETLAYPLQQLNYRIIIRCCNGSLLGGEEQGLELGHEAVADAEVDGQGQGQACLNNQN